MGRAFSFIALLAVLAVGAWFYMHQAQNVISGGTANPTATVDLMGVRNDLLAIAQAERSHAARSGGYVSLDELRSGGDLSMPRDHRGPYTYSAEISGTGFRIVATYSGAQNSGMPKSLSIDEGMQVRQE
jgi:hypothetical protein